MRLNFLPVYLLPILTIAAVPRAGVAQTCADQARLIATVRAATAPYRDPEVARRDGYRNISVDFPAMGEHWFNARIALLDTFDVAHPSLLLYARKKDQLVLLGAAFTALRDPGETPPGPAFLAHRWHGHAGTLDEELFAMRHGEHMDPKDFSVLVLHVWTWVRNDADPFAVENWRLPALRAGRPQPAGNNAARGLSLLKSTRYYKDALVNLGVPVTDTARLDGMLESYRAAASKSDDATRLAQTWARFLSDVGTRWPRVKPQLTRFTYDSPIHSECHAG